MRCINGASLSERLVCSQTTSLKNRMVFMKNSDSTRAKRSCLLYLCMFTTSLVSRPSTLPLLATRYVSNGRVEGRNETSSLHNLYALQWLPDATTDDIEARISKSFVRITGVVCQ